MKAKPVPKPEGRPNVVPTKTGPLQDIVALAGGSRHRLEPFAKGKTQLFGCLILSVLCGVACREAPTMAAPTSPAAMPLIAQHVPEFGREAQSFAEFDGDHMMWMCVDYAAEKPELTRIIAEHEASPPDAQAGLSETRLGQSCASLGHDPAGVCTINAKERLTVLHYYEALRRDEFMQLCVKDNGVWSTHTGVAPTERTTAKGTSADGAR